MTTLDVNVCNVLRELLAEVRGLRADLAEHRRGTHPQEDESVANLLRVIRTAIGDRVFNSAELARHAALPAAVSVEAAIVAAVGSLKPQRIGKKLEAIQGRNFCGLKVSRYGEDREGAIWMVAEVRESTPANPPCPLPS